MLERDDGMIYDEEDDYSEFDEEFKIPNSIWNKLYKYVLNIYFMFRRHLIIVNTLTATQYTACFMFSFFPPL